MKTFTHPDELRAHLGATPEVVLIHVLPAEVFAARRIPGSRNACVYEVSFLSQVEAMAPGKDTPLVLYGAGGDSHEATVAAEKLATAGYSHLTVFAGGLQAWAAAGEALEGNGELPSAPRLNGPYRVNTDKSLVRWTGRNLFNHHCGTLKPKEGRLQFTDNRLVGGSVILDMNSITCEDIVDPATKAILIRHLRDADFFLVDRYPTSEFVVHETTRISGSTEGTPNWKVRGKFTLRGVKQWLEFPVVMAAPNSECVTLQAQIQLDRTEFGSIYGSGRYFRYLGKHVVNDHIHLHLKLHADRTAA